MDDVWSIELHFVQWLVVDAKVTNWHRFSGHPSKAHVSAPAQVRGDNVTRLKLKRLLFVPRAVACGQKAVSSAVLP